MSLDTNIRDVIDMPTARYDWLTTENALGIELEYENFFAWPEPPYTLTWWRPAGDGSLRNGGLELVSVPLDFTQTDEALGEAENLLRTVPATATVRCGLHTHMNMRPYNVGQVWSLITLYAFIEPTIFNTYAINRVDSLFALPLWRDNHQLRSLGLDVSEYRRGSGGTSRSALCTSSHKYAALNFTSLPIFGTLEMRQPYCTTDFNAIKSWVAFCKRLIIAGTAFNDPFDVLEHYEQFGIGEIQRRLFGDTYPQDLDLQEAAEDAAYIIAGVVHPRWQDMNWDIFRQEVQA